ncbi:hypothetical protein JCM15765_24570 [Paradesulfitobacterium aromaticivorans]
MTIQSLLRLFIIVLLVLFSFQQNIKPSYGYGKIGTRLSGSSRYQTAKAISENLASGTVNNVVLCSGNGFADALAASVLAHKLGAPILLVDSGVDSSNDAFDYVSKHLDPSGSVYIIGGTGVISKDFEDSLNKLGFMNVKRIAGSDRYETDLDTVKEINAGSNSPVIIASGENYPDALAISGFAGYYGWPILLVQHDSVSEQIKTYIGTSKPSTFYIVGGTGVITSDVESQLESLVPNAKIIRLKGNDRFGTTAEVARTFAPAPSNIYLTTGFGFADALAGSALAAKNGEPILLIDPQSQVLPPAISSYLTQLYQNGINPTINTFGGEQAVPDSIISNVENILSGKTQTGLSSSFNQGAGYQAGAYDRNAAQPTDGNWSRQSRFIGPNTPESQWNFTTDYIINSSPAIGSDGTIYFGTTNKDFSIGNAKLYAVGNDGNKNWEFPIGVNVGSPVIDSDGTIYAGGGDGNLYAISSGGAKKWSFATNGLWMKASPAIGADGTIYTASSNDSKVFAIDKSGSKKWEFQLNGDYIDTTPSIGADGTIYVSSNGGKVYALTPQGNEKWESLVGTAETSPIGIGPDGTLYVGTSDNKLVALTSDRNKRWEFQTTGPIESIPAIADNGTIYVSVNIKAGEDGPGLYSISPDGHEQWEALKGKSVSSSPIIGSDGTVYVVTNDQKLYGINSNGSEKMEFLTGGIITSSPAIGQNGILYVGSYDGKLYAIGHK